MMNQSDKSPRRGRISANFEKRLRDRLMPLISYVASHENLDLQLRDNYFNIYFNGGNALRVTSAGFSFDPWYFYDGTYDGTEIPKTYVEERLKDKRIQRKSIPVNYPSKEVARTIYTEISAKARDLIARAEADDFESYFQTATEVVGKWVETYGRMERKKQHMIACSNRKFTRFNNLVVIDIEFAVSTQKPYNKAVSHTGSHKVPKMDIIAVDKYGQLYTIELKENLQADKDGTLHDVKNHLLDFKRTIGSNDPANDFPSEMAEVLQVKQRLGLLDEKIRIDTSRLPLFAVAYSGDNPKDLEEFRLKHSDLIMVDVISADDGKKQFLYLHQ